MNPGEPTWAAPSFHGDYRHTVDLSAFLSSAPLSSAAPLPPPAEEPPPYTEQLLEGHTSLMVGGKSTQPDKDDEDDTALDDADSSQLTARDVGILDRTPRDIEQDIVYQGSSPNTAEFVGTTTTSTEREYHEAMAEQIRANNQAMMVSLTRSPVRVESPRMNCENPFPDTHNTNYSPVPFFQRPLRSHSMDNGNYNVSTDTIQRDHTAASGFMATPFPPRQLAASTSNGSPQEIAPPLRRLWNPNNPLLARPPSRLPPLQCSTERTGSQRKRHKRKRGHSWHGERISSQAIAVTTSTMESLAE